MEDSDGSLYTNINEILANPKKSITSYPQPSSKQIWDDIITKRNIQIDILNAHRESKQCHIPIMPRNPEMQFLEENVFPVLLPVLEKTLIVAVKAECIKHQKSLFNGIDYIAERLWNMNNRYPERNENATNVFFIPFVQEWLIKHPRPIFPKSWIWSKEIATVKIQAYMRGHFVRKRDDVQEMRQFWKALKQQRTDSTKE